MDEISEGRSAPVEAAPEYSLRDLDAETILLLVEDKISTGG